MPKINVLKPFVFTRQPVKGHKIPREQPFTVGEHEIDEEMAAHPFISKHYADGCIESPKQAVARAMAAAKAAEKAALEAEEANKYAQQAFERTVTMARQQGDIDEEALYRELNTPINQLGAAHGASIDTPIPETESAKAAAGKAPDGAPAPGADADDGKPADSTGEAPAPAPAAGTETKGTPSKQTLVFNAPAAEGAAAPAAPPAPKSKGKA